MKKLTNQSPSKVFVDRGYRGHDAQEFADFICGSRRTSVTRTLKRHLRRRSTIELVIDPLKSDGNLSRHYFKGSFVDKINAIISGACCDLREILKKLGLFCFYYILFAGLSLVDQS